MKPVTLEIVTKLITIFDHHGQSKFLLNEAGVERNINQKELNEYPSELREELSRLSHWIRELRRLYKHRLFVKIIDAQSLLGIYKSLRFSIRRYPAFIIEGKDIYSGWDKEHLEKIIDKYIRASFIPKHGKIL